MSPRASSSRRQQCGPQEALFRYRQAAAYLEVAARWCRNPSDPRITTTTTLLRAWRCWRQSPPAMPFAVAYSESVREGRTTEKLSS